MAVPVREPPPSRGDARHGLRLGVSTADVMDQIDPAVTGSNQDEPDLGPLNGDERIPFLDALAGSHLPDPPTSTTVRASAGPWLSVCSPTWRFWTAIRWRVGTSGTPPWR